MTEKIFYSFLFLISIASSSIAQEKDSLSRQFILNAEIRPRAEYTSNYILPPNVSIDPYLYLTQRNRVSMAYSHKKWLVKSDFQEIHLWDQNSKAGKTVGLNFYQLFFETKFKSFNLRIGRQSVLLDNGRLFSDAPWAQQGRAHEGIRLMQQSKNFANDFFFLFTRPYSKNFEKAYSPVASNGYKYLMIYNLNYKFNERFSINSLNTVDFLEQPNSGTLYTRATVGGRIDFKKKNWFYTLNSYMQFGRNAKGQPLSAYYFQPEIKWTNINYTLRLGAEVISGSSPNLKDGHSGDFDVLYGVTWKFNGNMNVFTRFPADVGGKGLMNPYLFNQLQINSKLSLRNDFHLFYTQYPLANEQNQKMSRFLGFENDFSLRYSPIRQLDINCAFSFYQPTDSMANLPKIQQTDKTAFWSYLMVSYNFNAINFRH
ncbi:MAG: alginate export family protein [Flavobacterium sp.]|uniref:alginate export family protein n=1 Tax=Flavobacterium sp. TaxID=239 RepID=UPI001B0C755D|nr:alginate export family protein [Flavobacterium sp.]MBO9584442.1 alginate export family protein [Flavobacterium sp.]